MARILGNNSDGFANETEIINYLNDSRYYENLNANMRAFLSFLFQGADLEGLPIHAIKPTGMVKPDVAITINSTTRYVSVKKGSGNSVHQEKLNVFESYLRNCGINETAITYLKEFHYGDGSIDGNGGKRVSANDWISSNFRKVAEINRAFSNSGFLTSFFDRVLFVGNVSPAPTVDAIFHGNINSALWASREEIISYLLQQRNTPSSIHFSKLTYQVWNRNLNHNPNTADRRHVMQIKWTSMSNDLGYIKKTRH
ncbi:MAG: hypothetical protein NC393_06780 [Clostridium sp.]|nr:hypothetical protein [Clostridium sp.]MCM1171817.1 hypothetical protein [Clostridium sp.]MCM1207773.1 hypothetical protein [Ruminococcus sp.]